jgi:stage V sporulation protein R
MSKKTKTSNKTNKPFYNSSSWSFSLLNDAMKYCEEIAVEELNLDCYPNQIEVITTEQMLDCYASHGMPIMYKHWSFGKNYIQQERMYRKGMVGLAYEMVINANPCISYLMEENSMTMQTLVLAHAAFGHNHFFKNNNMFQEWTDADSIIDYLVFAQNFVAKCEQRYGAADVEKTLDACNAIQFQSINKYKRPKKLSMVEEKERMTAREEEIRKQVNDLWRTLPDTTQQKISSEDSDFIYPKEENLLYFIEKYSPTLEGWQRELCRITRKLGQYFFPQILTKVMNEGFASFTHYYIMNRLWEKGLIDDGSFLEFIQYHTAVLSWHDFAEVGFHARFNPYSLGFDIFDDIRRVCTTPTKEDEEWFPDICNTDWKKTWLRSAADFRDESFILQHLSPTIMRKRKMLKLSFDADSAFYSIDKIHDQRGFKDIRRTLSNQYSPASMFPDFQVEKVNLRGNRTLFLSHFRYNGVGLDNKTTKVLNHIKYLWGYKVALNSFDPNNASVTVNYTTD